ncbi:MAG: hypothetical protein LC750_03210 [Actinobacteria bacterium]|nr:hypothetical protein [Actinomycetota bacterium]
MTRTKRLLVAATLAALAFSTMGAHAAPRPKTMADVLRQRTISLAKSYGISPYRFFNATAKLQTIGSDGTVSTRSMRFRDAIESALSRIPASGSKEKGPQGTPEYEVGDIFHVWLYAGTDTTVGYTVKKSTVVPETPPVEPADAALCTALGGDPVTCATSGGFPLVAYDVGGPLYHISGGGWTGFHAAGFYFLGSNVDTGSSGPYLPVPYSLLPSLPSPVPPTPPLPFQWIGLPSDTSLDFLGHVYQYANITTSFCFLGYCFGFGGGYLYGGADAAIFDNHPVLGANVGFLDVP